MFKVRKVFGLVIAGAAMAAFGGHLTQPQASAAKVDLSTRDLVVPVGGRWKMNGAKFNMRDGLNYVHVNGHNKSVKRVKVSGKVNLNKQGTYTLTYRYGKAKKRAKVIVKKTNTVKVHRGANFNPAVKTRATSVNKVKFSTFHNRFVTKHNMTTTGASKGTYKMYAAYGPSLYGYDDAAVNQSIVRSGKYWYFLINKRNSKYSHVYRIDDALFHHLKHKYDLRHMYWWLHAGKAFHSNANWRYFQKLKRYIKVGPWIEVGHGQSMSMHKGTLYVTNQNDASNLKNINIVQISTKSLNIKKISGVRFNIDEPSPYLNKLGQLNMTFGAGNTIYLAAKINGTAGNGYCLYTGSLNGDTIKVTQASFGLVGVAGYHFQGLSYNASNKRLYFLSDGIYFSLPTNKITTGNAVNKMTSKDIHVTRISREGNKKASLTHPLEAESLIFTGKTAYYVTASFPVIHKANWNKVAR